MQILQMACVSQLVDSFDNECHRMYFSVKLGMITFKHEGSQQFGRSGARTHNLWIMNPASFH